LGRCFTTITTGSGNTFIGYIAGKSCETGSNNTFIGTNAQLQPGKSAFSRSIALGAGVEITNNDQFVVASNVTSFNISGLTASTGTRAGTILEFDSSGNIIPSAGTYNSVSKIDTIISTIQGQLPAEILFTTTSTDPPNVTWTVPASVNSITIEASVSGAPGTLAIATSTSGVYQGGGGGGSGQVGNITIPVAEGMELTISLGAVSPPGNTVAYGTTVEINGIQIITCNGANGNTSRMDGGNGAALFANVFCSYSCGGGGGMNSDGGGTSGSGSSGLTSFFDGSALAEWGSGNSGNGGLNNNEHRH